MLQRTSEAKPRIFTFMRSGWIMRVIAADVCFGVLAAVLVWFRLVMPVLPPQRWIRYSLTIVGVLVFYVVFEFALRTLVSGPVSEWMKDYDDRASATSSDGKERKQATGPNPISPDVETAYERKRA